VSLDGERLNLGALDARIAGARLKGQLDLALGSPTRIEGRLDADTIDAAAVIAAAIGSPPVARRDAPWSPEPFVAGPPRPRAGRLAKGEGRLDFSVANATLASGIAGRQLRGTLRFAPATIMLDRIEGLLAEGRLIAQADVRAAATGVATRMQVSLVNADLAAL